jgi:hypothetical protein
VRPMRGVTCAGQSWSQGPVQVSGRVNGGTIGTHTAAPRGRNEKSGAPVFGNQDAIAQRSSPELASNRATVKPLRRLPPRQLHEVQTVQPSPSAHEFRLLLNGLPTSALRRMFCSEEGACVRPCASMRIVRDCGQSWPRGLSM